jgi:hypothetical protein
MLIQMTHNSNEERNEGRQCALLFLLATEGAHTSEDQPDHGY